MNPGDLPTSATRALSGTRVQKVARSIRPARTRHSLATRQIPQSHFLTPGVSLYAPYP
jgi:hypothetical protein